MEQRRPTRTLSEAHVRRLRERLAEIDEAMLYRDPNDRDPMRRAEYRALLRERIELLHRLEAT